MSRRPLRNVTVGHQDGITETKRRKADQSEENKKESSESKWVDAD